MYILNIYSYEYYLHIYLFKSYKKKCNNKKIRNSKRKKKRNEKESILLKCIVYTLLFKFSYFLPQNSSFQFSKSAHAYKKCKYSIRKFRIFLLIWMLEIISSL